MTLQPFKDEQLNYFKFVSLVLNEFPKALRQTFKSMWDNTFGHLPPWNDSILVRNLFRTKEGGTTKVPTNLSYEKWDCTALFQATIYAKSFALPDSKGHHKTLSDLYVKPHKPAPGKFHASVMSPGGNRAETLALAIDQLRLLRNSLCHSTSSEIIKPTFDQFVQLSKDAFKALGVKTDPIDVIGGLTESNFPTKEVGKLRQAMRDETLAYLKFLEGMCSEIHELSTAIRGEVEGSASKEDIASLEQKINDLRQVLAQGKQDTKPSLSKPCLPPTVPHFTGRQKECEEITGHVTSGSTRIVSIWGSPGFGKTSVAIAVGHHLHSQGLPVYYLSLRGLQSTADLASQFLSLFGRPAATGGHNQRRLSVDDEIFRLFSEMSDPFTIVLDNADELLSGGPKMKEDFTHLLSDILRRTEKVTFVVTTRESLEFLNVQLQGHQAVRIRPLDEPSSQNLVNKLLPKAIATECKRVTQICGHVPLAIKLLCSSISEDNSKLIQVLDDLSIVEMLENRDYPSNLRLELLFDSSFQRLSAQEKEALVSLCVLPDSFDPTIAAAVLGIPKIPLAIKVLHDLRRKALLESGSKPDSFLMHPLTRSFVNQKGEHEMKETALTSKARLRAFYIRRFKELNEKFLTGHSMSAFIDFYKDEQSITQSLIEGCSDSKTANSVFEVLVEAELFLYSIYWKKEFTFNKIYDSAIKKARSLKENVFCRQLLVSKALYHVTWSSRGKTTDLLSEAKVIEASSSPVSAGDKGKHLCYSGINQLVNGETTAGVQCLEEALSSMNDTPEQTVLRIIAFQILAMYYRSQNDSPRISYRYLKAVLECGEMGNTQLCIIPGMECSRMKVDDNGMTQEPLKLAVLFLVSEATEHLTDSDTRRSMGNAAKEMAKDVEKPPVKSSLGSFTFQCNANIILQHVLKKVAGDAVKVFKESTTSCHATELNQCKRTQSFQMLVRGESTSNHWYSFGNTAVLSRSTELFEEQHLVQQNTRSCHEKALNQCKRAQSFQTVKDKSTANVFSFRNPTLLSFDRSAELSKGQRMRSSGTAASYHSFGDKQHGKPKDPISVLRSNQSAHIKQKLSGEQHSRTADSYHLLGATQHENGDSSSAPQSPQRAVNNRREMLREEPSSTADTCDSLGVTQHTQGNFSSTFQSAQCALSSSRKLSGEEDSGTAESYHSLGVTQHAQGDFTSSLQSTQRALDIRRKLLGEEHSITAESYHLLGVTQHAQGDFTSSLQSAQRALDIRLKLFGEEHFCTADSYDLLSTTQHEKGELSSSLQSAQHALSIRRSLFGEEHSSTADSYDLLSVTQHAQGDFSSALQTSQRAFDIRLKLFGEEHLSTADSYHSLGDTHHAQGDFSQALQYKQRALGIRLKLFGEEHSNTADSYDSIGDTQHAQGDFSSAFQSTQRALQIRRKLFGEEHASTAESYYSLGITQHAQGDFSSALQFAQRALDIRLKMFGKEHASTADSYHSLGIIQHALGDFSAALQCQEHALDIRRRLFGERHSSTAESYDSLGDTQHAQALQFKLRALNIRLKLLEKNTQA